MRLELLASNWTIEARPELGEFDREYFGREAPYGGGKEDWGMGDKSPKSTNRQAKQKQVKNDAAEKKKRQAIAAKQVPKKS